jgi:acetylornithine deacetylase/succinyl-diaminopimelate desuccinylase-like protein
MAEVGRFWETHREDIEKLFSDIGAARNSLIDRVREIAEIPSPSFQEDKRSRYLAEAFPAAGLSDTTRLPKGSVIGFTGSAGDENTLLLAAHIDNVFPIGTDLTTRIEGSTLFGPGTGDNAANVAAILTLAELLHENDMGLTRNIAFCGTVCEEASGNLAGMAEVLDHLGGRLKAVIAVDGRTPYIMHRSQAIRRYRLRATGPGGHSWDGFGTPSAIHEMARVVAALAALDVPAEPRTTFNVGTIHGGKSVNAIAQECTADVDLRSLETHDLENLERGFLDIVERLPHKGIGFTAEMAGERPAAEEPQQSTLVKTATAAAAHIGFQTRLTASSTDAALSLARGISSISMGTYRGTGVHTLEETVDLDSLTTGLKWLALTVMALAA